MAKLSLSEVSNRFNVSRSTLYRAIKEGRISRGADGLFDVAEVIRCFGEPIKKHDLNQVTTSPKDDADLRQLVDFMRKEIESYKDREKRYLDQIDRFQLLLGHKEPEDKMSHDTPVTQTNETPCDSTNGTKKDFDNKGILEKVVSHDVPMKRTSGTHWNASIKRDETAQKRSLFSRVLNAIISDE